MSSISTQSQLCTATPTSSICSVSDFILAFAFDSPHIYFNQKSIDIDIVYIVYLLIFLYFCLISNPLKLICSSILSNQSYEVSTCFIYAVV